MLFFEQEKQRQQEQQQEQQQLALEHELGQLKAEQQKLGVLDG